VRQTVADTHIALCPYEPDWNEPDYLTASMACDVVWEPPGLAAEMILVKFMHAERTLFRQGSVPLPPGRLIVELFDNPFGPVTLVRAWVTWDGGTIPKLAQGIYDDRAFDRLPILADALEDAGCTDADILNHCRQPSVHVRGCWVIDLLLGKE